MPSRRHRIDALLRRNFAVLLCLHSLIAALIGLRILPFPSLSDNHAEPLAVILACGFLLLSCLVAALLWSQRTRDASYAELLHLVLHDAETGLASRAAIERAIDTCQSDGQPCACLCMEIDGVEGSDQHAGASALLQSVVSRLRPFAIDGSMLGRLSHDRFVLLLRGMHSRPDLTLRAEKLLEVLVPPHAFDGNLATTNISMGIAVAPGDAHDRVSLLAAAKHAMTLARSDDRNQFRFAQDLQASDDARNSRISGKLQRALLEGTLQLFYQPIYNGAGEMVAAEALARWHDDEVGSISPAEFVPVAEATGLIVPLSNWVLRKACSQMAEWIAMGSSMRRIAVNVSVKQVCRSDFIQNIQQTLDDTGLDARCLELEVTEGAMASDFEAVNRNLQSLRRLGVRISIDDFGTGYSSLGRVRDLHADVLKIDRVFTQAAVDSKGAAAMVQAIIKMAHTLQLSVVAEGIETKEQMNLLRRMACDEMQGFLLAPPQAAETLTLGIRQSLNPLLTEKRPVRMNPQPAAVR